MSDRCSHWPNNVFSFLPKIIRGTSKDSRAARFDKLGRGALLLGGKSAIGRNGIHLEECKSCGSAPTRSPRLLEIRDLFVDILRLNRLLRCVARLAQQDETYYRLAAPLCAKEENFATLLLVELVQTNRPDATASQVQQPRGVESSSSSSWSIFDNILQPLSWQEV